jgi:hypothetical protein
MRGPCLRSVTSIHFRGRAARAASLGSLSEAPALTSILEPAIAGRLRFPSRAATERFLEPPGD